ncbi:hypothetical protein CYY_002704 [Polysphondylium violaceum]|uniref:Glycerate kinase n=1 Tax=Polysphondylium violaceum TaxID=133409 RepID=A0A8J4PZR9_9MYCE|nr:hypothetical protein CYY_002704 [Polysphondylium violaceum]
MKTLISFDKFKDCMSSFELGCITLDCLKKHTKNKSDDVKILRMSDGGEGLLESLTYSLGLETKVVNDIVGPLGTLIQSKYAYSKQHGYAVIEMALASGLEMVPVSQRNPFNTTTHGVGQLILDAVTSGFTKIIIGAGGSATNDAGLGALSAMGAIKVTLKQEDGSINNNNNNTTDIIYGKHLNHIQSITQTNIELFKNITFEFLTDVTNPMIGTNGAVYSFSGQKGASENDKIVLEKGMENVSSLYPRDISKYEGSGAAGGLPSGFIAYFNAKITKGIEFVCESYSLEKKLESGEIDLIITGEGCFDKTTLDGKVVSKIMSLADKYNIKCLVICGKKIIDDSYQTFNKDACKIFSLVDLFGAKESLTNTKLCIESLFESNLELKSFLNNCNISSPDKE